MLSSLLFNHNFIFPISKMKVNVAYVILIIAILALAYYVWKSKNPLSDADRDEAMKALKYLEDHPDDVIDVQEETLHDMADKIYLVKSQAIAVGGDRNEDFEFPINTNYWPQYYYSYPYQYKYGGAWPPGMFSRLYEWSPGFYVSGWRYGLRPGLKFGRWNRNRWVRHNNSYYFINNTGYD
jgi:hypothetical protein